MATLSSKISSVADYATAAQGTKADGAWTL